MSRTHGAPPPQPGPAAPVRLRDRIGRRALHILCVLLVSFSVALLVRPAYLLVASLEEDGIDLGRALVAVGYHLVLVVLAVTLYRRTRPSDRPADRAR